MAETAMNALAKAATTVCAASAVDDFIASIRTHSASRYQTLTSPNAPETTMRKMNFATTSTMPPHECTTEGIAANARARMVWPTLVVKGAKFFLCDPDAPCEKS